MRDRQKERERERERERPKPHLLSSDGTRLSPRGHRGRWAGSNADSVRV